MSNNYMNIGFRLELESKYWSDVYLLRSFVSDNLVRLAFSRNYSAGSIPLYTVD